ncbi:MAG: ABC transporter ATP-binding protein [Lautropia sp.]|nr:MAG: ABC transporter ATP-binding protein [Pseudomonadota bacterium]MBC6958789.1 ABC transporter ATP-binding protein [Lautropia sp.]MDL1907803.1 ABC transporter ATP-binding protein [Betaproteobacteria bacterium PRO1]RIK89382.1 MAG: ABC transporter ATP-binding protein [Burkholderiales bacterium]
MSRIALSRTGHRYGPAGAYALEPFDFEFDEACSYALLGPSGCGKTTMLNIISGLVRPSEGKVLIRGQDVTDVPTAGRNIAQVFQFPVVYQSKTVYENLAFPLVCRGWPRDRIRLRVEEISNLLGLDESLGRRAVGLTADAKQLISLGRGLVRDDVVALLLDEPLTVIDPQLKTHLRRKLKEIIGRSKLTVIYVTHDQNEAMTFAQQVVVMSAGRIVQRGTPEELFEMPGTTYVGYFIGSPAMNLFDAAVSEGGLRIAGATVPVPPEWLATAPEGAFQVGIRPEYVSFADASDPLAIPTRVLGIEDHGSVRVLDVEIGNARAKMKVDRETSVPEGPAALAFAPGKLRVFVDDRLVA